MYITFIYFCNKAQPYPIHVAHSLDDIVAYIGTYINEDELANIVRDSIEDGTDNNVVVEINKQLDENEYIILHVPIKYSSKFVDEKSFEEINTLCKHDEFELMILKTNEDGTFQKQLDNAAECFV